MKVCMCVWQPTGGPTQSITPKFGMGSSFHLASAPSLGATKNVKPQPCPLLLLNSLDQSAQYYFTVVL